MFKDFNDCIAKCFSKLAVNYKKINKNIRSLAFLAVSIVLVALSLYCSGVRIGYTLSYNGQKLATVSNKSIFEKAENIVASKVSGKNIKKQISAPSYSVAMISLSTVENDAREIADGIISNTDSFVKGVKVTVDDNVYLCRSNNSSDIVENYLSKFDIENAKSSSTFEKNVSIKDGVFLLSDIDNVTLSDVLRNVPVKTVVNLVSEKEVDYKTVVLKSSEMVKGCEKVTCEGAKGLSKIVEEVEYLDGNEVSRNVISQEVVTDPVNKVVVVGTSVDSESAAKNAIAHNSGFVFPIFDSYKIGDTYGDNRNHKGYDILAAKGTPIHAVKDGVVTRAAWYKGYGYCVDIDHGNGMVTRYGHASEFAVSAGQKVSSGDVIAYVGSTGNSSGNHVHFEVIINGNHVNPGPYINME